MLEPTPIDASGAATGLVKRPSVKNTRSDAVTLGTAGRHPVRATRRPPLLTVVLLEVLPIDWELQGPRSASSADAIRRRRDAVVDDTTVTRETLTIGGAHSRGGVVVEAVVQFTPL